MRAYNEVGVAPTRGGSSACVRAKLAAAMASCVTLRPFQVVDLPPALILVLFFFVTENFLIIL